MLGIVRLLGDALDHVEDGLGAHLEVAAGAARRDEQVEEPRDVGAGEAGEGAVADGFVLASAHDRARRAAGDALARAPMHEVVDAIKATGRVAGIQDASDRGAHDARYVYVVDGS